MLQTRADTKVITIVLNKRAPVSTQKTATIDYNWRRDTNQRH